MLYEFTFHGKKNILKLNTFSFESINRESILHNTDNLRLSYDMNFEYDLSHLSNR